LYYVPETRAYRISGSAKLFPQHCQVPNLSPNAHLKALTKELQTTTATAAKTTKGRRLIKSLATAIKAILTPTNAEEQRVATDIGIEIPNRQEAPILTIQGISDAPEIMQARDPTAKQNLITTARIYQHQTQNNSPGALLKITRAQLALVQPDPSQTTMEKR
jgi:hypothetical protein